MKKYLWIILFLFLLVACINTDGPSYIDSIDCFVNEELIEGKLQYFDEEKNVWLDYDSKTKAKMKVYYTLDVQLDDSLEVVFNFYNPHLVIDIVKTVHSLNLDYHPNQTYHYYALEKEEDYTKVVINIEALEGDFNLITIPSYMTNRGIKYQGRKSGDNNYAIWGVHFNII